MDTFFSLIAVQNLPDCRMQMLPYRIKSLSPSARYSVFLCPALADQRRRGRRCHSAAVNNSQEPMESCLQSHQSTGEESRHPPSPNFIELLEGLGYFLHEADLQ